MKSIRIQNVRSLKDTGDIQLLPINILVGQNSSGKSTFLRMFPLIKQSFNKRTDGPILWAGDVDDYVDFGSFQETITHDNSDKIVLSFGINQKDINPSVGSSTLFHYIYNNAIQKKVSTINEKLTYSVSIQQKPGNKGEYVSSVIIGNHSHSIELLSPGDDNGQGEIIIDGRMIINNPMSFDEEKTEAYFKYLLYYDLIPFSFNHKSPFGLTYNIPISREMLQLLDSLTNKEISKRDAVNFLHLSYKHSSVALGLMTLGCASFFNIPFQEAILWTKHPAESGGTLVRSTEAREAYLNIFNIIDSLPPRKKQIAIDLSMILFAVSFIEPIERYIEMYFNQVHYIAPLRATAERYYRLRNLSLSEVDHQGKNLAMFLNGLSAKRMADYQKWTEKHFGFVPLVKKNEGHLSVDISRNRNSVPVNLSDTGFGYSQILPIVTQLWDLATRERQRDNANIPLVIAIEQPELHLHPALQAKLVAAFIASINLAKKHGYEMQLILETHSDTIVNCFGKAIEQKKISTAQTQVLLFDRDYDSISASTKVRISEFDKDGFLQNWPIGFFAPEE